MMTVVLCLLILDECTGLGADCALKRLRTRCHTASGLCGIEDGHLGQARFNVSFRMTGFLTEALTSARKY